jgi:outer membrane protein insertion porin family
MGRPISLGFTLFGSQYQYVGSGLDYTSQQAALISQFYGSGVLNADTLFTQKTAGGSVSLSGSLQLFTKKFVNLARFTRLQMSYSLTGSTVQDPSVNRDSDPKNDIPVSYSQPRIITSRILPSIYYNTKNASLDPTSGKSLFLGLALSGGVLGGDVNTIAPQLEFQYFKPVLRRRSEKPHVLAMRFKVDHLRAYGEPPPFRQGDTRSLAFVGGVPIFERFFLGGEYDIRGYNIRSLGPIVRSDTFASTRGPITAMKVDPNDSTKLVPYDGPLDPSVSNQLTFQAPEGRCAAAANGPVDGCNVVYRGSYPTLLGGDTQAIYNIEYRVPIISVLSVAAFADVGTAFNARKYNDQITSTNFVTGQVLPLGTPSAVVDLLDGGVIINPSGSLATQADIDTAPKDEAGNPIGFNKVFFQGQTQTFDLVRTSQSNKWRLSQDLRSSLGLEFRVQMPVINVPFRLIMAYNPYADNQNNIYVQKKTVIRFSVGRTF